MHAVECAVLKTGPGPASRTNPKAVMDYYRSDALFTLRCILLQIKYPQKWSQLLSLESHDEERIGTNYYE